MLKYNGKLYFDKPLSPEELNFLQDWQSNLVSINKDYVKAGSKSQRENISEEINGYSGIAFDEKQRWTIFFAMNPMIYFHKDYIELKGSNKKGNLREAIMAYHHFFIGEDAVLKECMDLNFMKPHNLNGIIEASKKDSSTSTIESKWCYLVENNIFSSIEVDSIKEYEKSPLKFHKIIKEDTFHQHLARYFPPLMNYASLKKSIREKNEAFPREEKKSTRLKI